MVQYPLVYILIPWEVDGANGVDKVSGVDEVTGVDEVSGVGEVSGVDEVSEVGVAVGLWQVILVLDFVTLSTTDLYT